LMAICSTSENGVFVKKSRRLPTSNAISPPALCAVTRRRSSRKITWFAERRSTGMPVQRYTNQPEDRGCQTLCPDQGGDAGIIAAIYIDRTPSVLLAIPLTLCSFLALRVSFPSLLPGKRKQGGGTPTGRKFFGKRPAKGKGPIPEEIDPFTVRFERFTGGVCASLIERKGSQRRATTTDSPGSFRLAESSRSIRLGANVQR
jgi:hypothetical protein